MGAVHARRSGEALLRLEGRFRVEKCPGLGDPSGCEDGFGSGIFSGTNCDG